MVLTGALVARVGPRVVLIGGLVARVGPRVVLLSCVGRVVRWLKVGGWIFGVGDGPNGLLEVV